MLIYNVPVHAFIQFSDEHRFIQVLGKCTIEIHLHPATAKTKFNKKSGMDPSL